MSYSPKFPYDGKQAIINSGRIVLNSKDDSIFLFSSKAICLSSNEGIHLNTEKEVIINTSNLQLGIDAKEPLVKGNELKNLLTKLLDDLSNVGEQLLIAIDSNNNPLPSVQTAGNSLVKSTKRIKKLLQTLNSTQNFTL